MRSRTSAGVCTFQQGDTGKYSEATGRNREKKQVEETGSSIKEKGMQQVQTGDRQGEAEGQGEETGRKMSAMKKQGKQGAAGRSREATGSSGEKQSNEK